MAIDRRRLCRSLPLLALPALHAAEPPATEAEVRRVDLAQHRLTLRHGPIPHLDMMPMTMVFDVPEASDRAQLPALKPGQKLRFVAEHRNGRYLARQLSLLP